MPARYYRHDIKPGKVQLFNDLFPFSFHIKKCIELTKLALVLLDFA
jgi:hypothetical protein